MDDFSSLWLLLAFMPVIYVMAFVQRLAKN